MSNSEVLYYIVLFTAQKQKKFKTWQDGTMKYYLSNKKLVLLDEKGYNIDRLFHKGRDTPGVGDEFEFDRHIVTIEAIEQSSTPSNTITAAINNMSTTNTASSATTYSSAQSIPKKEMEASVNNISHSITPASSSIRSRDSNRAPGLPRKRLLNINNNGGSDPMDIDHAPFIEQTEEATSIETPQAEVVTPAIANIPSMHSIPNNLSDPTPLPQPVAKRFRVGLSKRLENNKMPHANLHSEATTAASNAISPVKKNPTSIRSFKPPLTNQQSTYSAAASSSSSPASSATATAAAGAGASFAPASTIRQQEQQPGQESAQGISKPFKTPFAEGSYVPLTLQFPSKNKAMTIMMAKKHPKRTKVVPMKFSNTSQYQTTFQKVIYEHLEILLFNYSVYFYMTCEKFAKGKKDFELERTIRSKGLGMYTNCELIRESNYERRVKLRLKNREMHSKYSKDDIWVVSKNQMFDANYTFLARSTFYGPFSDGTLELDCLSARDGRVAATLATSNQTHVCALRTISASSEFMMLDTLEDRLESLPLLPYIMGSTNRKGKKKQQPDQQQQIVQVNDLQHIKLTRQDGIDVGAKLKDTIDNYNLNEDQAKVLESVARSVITSPGWNETTLEPITLVHGVYGSGKSFLAAVIIIFIQGIVELACEKREPEDHFTFKIIVSSMTNVAVDRILQTLLKLGYDQFVRIGSVKKIAKNILPFTARSKPAGNEELKELEQMLDEEQNSEEDAEHIAAAIQRFRKAENAANVNLFQVVGTTLASSVFDVFTGMRFPLCLIDEASQIMEPLSMVPITRFLCNRLIMIGDPLQLPPTITTTSEESKVGQGLDKTMFNRLMETGLEPIMLRTQYRCHPLISSVSNKLFYSSQLMNGITHYDRKPLIEGLPTLLFIDVGGREEKSFRTNSFWNDTEVALAAHLIQTLADNGIPPSDLGVISLYKEQADKISEFLGSKSSNVSGKNVQISTVDAFQGGEKEVIILSTVRTTENAFMTNRPRINVSLTRARRHLIILGNKSIFSMNELWTRIMWDCQENCISGQDLGRFLNNLKLNHNAEVDL